MNQTPSDFVSIHPTFRVHSGKLADFKALLPAFVEKTQPEEKVLFYDFTINEEAGEIFCREGYRDAEGLLTHLQNVDALLKQALGMAELLRLEIHGPAAEVAKLKAPLADLKPAWFLCAGGISAR